MMQAESIDLTASPPPKKLANVDLTASPPPKKRALQCNLSDPKLPYPKKTKVEPSDEQEAMTKGATRAEHEQQRLAAARSKASLSKEEASMQEHCDKHGLTEAQRARILPIMRKWGQARLAQVLGLWSFFGDGESLPGSTAALQVWGPVGSGKTALVRNFLRTLGLRHVYLNCGCYASLNDLWSRLVEELRRLALRTSADSGSGSADHSAPKDLHHRPAKAFQHLRALDRLEGAFSTPLEHLMSRSDDGGKVVVVLDHSQELHRFGAQALELILALPEILQQGDHFCVMTVGRLPLACLGLPRAREPPSIVFQPLTAAEAEAILIGRLSQVKTPTAALSDPELRSLGNCVMKFAAPVLGYNLHHLNSVGEEVALQQLQDKEKASFGKHPVGRSQAEEVAEWQQRVEGAVQRRLGISDPTGLLKAGEVSANQASLNSASTLASLGQMTEAEKRLVLAAYLGSRIDKEDDVQLFTPAGRRKRQRRGPVVKQRHNPAGDDGVPVFAQAPQSLLLTRLLAIYHHLARHSELTRSATLLEHVMQLRELGHLRFAKDRSASLDKDTTILCRVELAMARACADELDVRISDYLAN